MTSKIAQAREASAICSLENLHYFLEIGSLTCFVIHSKTNHL